MINIKLLLTVTIVNRLETVDKLISWRILHQLNSNFFGKLWTGKWVWPRRKDSEVNLLST